MIDFNETEDRVCALIDDRAEKETSGLESLISQIRDLNLLLEKGIAEVKKGREDLKNLTPNPKTR